MGRPKKSDKEKSSSEHDESSKISKKQPSSKKSTVALEDDENIDLSRQFQIVQKRFPLSDIDYTIFSNVPVQYKINKDTDVGLRVVVAKYPAFYKIYFMQYIDAGAKHFPNGGIKVYNSTFDQTQYHRYESVALHPTKKDKYRVTTIE